MNSARDQTMLETAIVRVMQGELRGCRVESRAGGSMWKFLGIPYARPPVGSLRFKDPQPPESWMGVRDALKEGSPCSQKDIFSGQITGSEDCLYLNVYMPSLPSPDSRSLPVMVYIHGGGFVCGSGGRDWCGSDYLLAEDVIFVSFNYRLSVFGFLYLEEASPGNAGLKDQVAALRWVQRNIAAFGGDPNNVTLFGMSAGGASVHMHMLSPMSKGLFQRAVSMSGAAMNPWAQQTQPQETTRRLARLLGCTSEDPATIVDFLRTVDHKKLVRVISVKAKTLLFVPSTEKIVPGIEAFLSSSCEQLLQEGKHHDVSFMAGIAEKEGLFPIIFNGLKIDDVEELEMKWINLFLPDLRLPTQCDKSAAVNALRQFYLDGKSITNDTVNGFIDMLSDITFATGVHFTLKYIAEKSTSSVYQYLFAVDDELNSVKRVFKINAKGACHCDDGGYIFSPFLSDVEVPEVSSAAITRRRYVRLMTNFAKTGDPTPEDDPLLGARWTPFSLQQRHFLEIGSSLRPATALHARRVAFWEDFYRSFGGAARPAPSPQE